MMLYPYLHLVGAQAPSSRRCTGGPARRYGDLSVLTTPVLGLAWGAGTVGGAKHLRRAEAGALVALVAQAASPELGTLRARCSALAEYCDPLGLQRAFAAGMLAAGPAAETVYFVDDHFVPHTGGCPLATGWNTKRRHAQPGRDDTLVVVDALVVDACGRAVLFASARRRGWPPTCPGYSGSCGQVLGPHAPVLLGFDRAGSYPCVFTTCQDPGADWVS